MTIVFKRTTNSAISKMSTVTAMIIQAIKAIGKDSISDEQISYLRKKLTDQDKENLLREGKFAAAWIYRILRRIGE